MRLNLGIAMSHQQFESYSILKIYIVHTNGLVSVICTSIQLRSPNAKYKTILAL